MNFHQWWDSIERLSRVVTLANWGIALSLLIGFGCTVLAIKAGSKRDKLIAIEDSKREQKVADTLKLAADANERAGKASERAATLEVEALRLRMQLASQGPRANLLTAENRRRLVEALKPFSGQKIDVRRSAWALEVNGAVVSSTPLGDDTVGLSEALVGILKEAGWQVPSAPLLAARQGYGLKVWFREGASAESQSAAKVLVQALRKVPLTVSGPSAVPENLTRRVGTATVVPPLTKDTIILIVLTHP